MSQASEGKPTWAAGFGLRAVPTAPGPLSQPPWPLPPPAPWSPAATVCSEKPVPLGQKDKCHHPPATFLPPEQRREPAASSAIRTPGSPAGGPRVPRQGQRSHRAECGPREQPRAAEPGPATSPPPPPEETGARCPKSLLLSLPREPHTREHTKTQN